MQRQRSLYLLSLLVFLIILAASARAQEAEEYAEDVEIVEDDLSDTAALSQEDIQAQIEALSRRQLVKVRSLLPRFLDGKVPQGELVDVVVSVENIYASPVNVSVLRGQLTSAIDFSQALYNYSAVAYNEILPPGQQISLLYRFHVDPYFEPREYGYVMGMMYEDSDGFRRYLTVYNQTISVVEPSTSWTASSVLQKLLGFGTLAACAVVLFLVVSEPSVKTTSAKERAVVMPKHSAEDAGAGAESSSARTEATAAALPSNVNSDFIPAHVLATLQAGKPKARKSKSSGRESGASSSSDRE